jgi:hypothetical protein
MTTIVDGDAQLIETLVDRLGVLLALCVVGAAVIVTLGWQFLKAGVERRATAAVDRELDAHRARLQLSADAVRLDFQRRLADFGEYNSQRHRSYRRIFRSALESEGAYSGLLGGFIGSDYSRASREQIASMLESLGVPGETRVEVVSEWDLDRAAANTMLDVALRRSREAKAQQAFQRFKNETLLWDLYVSQEVREAIMRLNLTLAALSAHLMVPSDTGRPPLILKEEANTRIVALRDAMSRDLSRGDYGTALAVTLSPD